MNPDEKSELIELCRVHLREDRLPTPLPSNREEYAKWREQAAAHRQYSRDGENAWFELYDLAATSPDQAWEILRELVSITVDEGELQTIGAGVLESFVRRNGSQFAEEIENEMFSNPRFITAMRMVNGIEAHPLSERISHFFGR